MNEPDDSPSLFSVQLQFHSPLGGERLDKALARAVKAVSDSSTLTANDTPPAASLIVASEGDSVSILGSLSRTRLRALIEAGEVMVNGALVSPSAGVRGDEVVTIRIPVPERNLAAPEKIPLSVLFEDDQLIAVDKPAGMVVHPAPGHPSGTLVNALMSHCNDLSGVGGVLRPGIVHRLDRDTSGVIVAAKTDAAHHGLAAQFAQRTANKTYLAWVFGCPSPRAAKIDAPIGRHPRHRQRFSSGVRGGKPAVTNYKTIAAAAGLSCLEVKPATGRTHQIRVHFADHNHPIVADEIYGGKRWSQITSLELRHAAMELTRHALHAARLVLQHPTTGETLDLKAPIPEELSKLLEIIESGE